MIKKSLTFIEISHKNCLLKKSLFMFDFLLDNYQKKKHCFNTQQVYKVILIKIFSLTLEWIVEKKENVLSKKLIKILSS